ncbi:MAG: element excision factor XisI family protein [Nostoc sp.]|uniref:element excision factor XisI family protein n=1 Tax=Nostoc sp. TaxID=1180 RepID=UPI002FF32E72
MADLDKYQKWIRQLFTEYAQRASSNNEIEAQTIFDGKQDHYQMIYIRPLAKINYGTIVGLKNLLSISIRHPNEVTKLLCIDSDMDFF